MDKIIKLSQAIRLGATFRPQCCGAMYEKVYADGTIGSCALGAAAEALGAVPVSGIGCTDEDADPFDPLLERFREVLNSELDPPEPPGRPDAMSDNMAYRLRRNGKISVQQLVVYLNDIKRWSRERIASYLEEKGL